MKNTLDGTVIFSKRTVKQWARLVPGILGIVAGARCLIQCGKRESLEWVSTVLEENGYPIDKPNK